MIDHTEESSDMRVWEIAHGVYCHVSTVLMQET